MATPVASDVLVNVPLTTVSVAFVQQATDFVASQVFSTLPSEHQSALYFEYPRGEWFRSQMQQRAPGAESAGSGWTVNHTATYTCLPFALHKDIPDQLRANAMPPINLDNDSTLWLTQQFLIKKDIDFVNAYFKSGVWTVDADVTNASYGNGQWSAGGSTPLKDIRKQITAMKKLTGMRPNKLVLGAEVWSILQDHPDFLDRIGGGATTGIPANMNLQLLAGFLGLQQVLVAEGVQNTAAEGVADAFSFIAGKNALLVYSNPNPSIMQPSAGYTFAWTGLFGSGADGQRVSRFRIEERKSDRVEIETAYALKLVSADCGCFFPSCVA